MNHLLVVIANRERTRAETLRDSLVERQVTARIGRTLHPEGLPMDQSNLFSHPDAPKYVASAETSGKPVENPTFSDRPDADGLASAMQRS
jgi:hypothetical protein